MERPMKPIRRATARVLAALVAAALAGPAVAGSAIEVTDPWARPSIPNRPGAAYLVIHNSGNVPDRLVGVRAEGAGAVELHRAEEKGGMMTMAPVEAIEIPAGGTAQLAPGGFHIMLFDLAAPLAEGDTLTLTLEFEQAGEIGVEAEVTQRGMGHGGAMQHQGTDHGSSGN